MSDNWPDEFDCTKCGKHYHAFNKVDGSDEIAAWDGGGRFACWDCFGRFGWKAFPGEVRPALR